jgi:hypothetical protein
MPLILALLALGALVLVARSSKSGPMQDGSLANPYAFDLSNVWTGTASSIVLKAGTYYRVHGQMDANGEGWVFLPADATVVHYVAPVTGAWSDFLIQAGPPGGNTMVTVLGQGAPTPFSVTTV